MSVEIVINNKGDAVPFRDIEVGEFFRAEWQWTDYQVYLKINETDAFNVTLKHLTKNIDQDFKDVRLNVRMEVGDEK